MIVLIDRMFHVFNYNLIWFLVIVLYSASKVIIIFFFCPFSQALT